MNLLLEPQENFYQAHDIGSHINGSGISRARLVARRLHALVTPGRDMELTRCHRPDSPNVRGTTFFGTGPKATERGYCFHLPIAQ